MSLYRKENNLRKAQARLDKVSKRSKQFQIDFRREQNSRGRFHTRAYIVRGEKEHHSGRGILHKAVGLKYRVKQKGLLLKVLSLPNTWRFSVSGLVKICKEGKSAIKTRLAELTELGYLVRTQLKSNESKSRGFEYIYEFFEIALSKEDAEKKSEKTRKNAKKSVKDLFPKKSKKSGKTGAGTAKKQHSGFRSAENPSAEKPQAEKQAQLNTNEKIKNLVIKNPSVLLLRREKSGKSFNNLSTLKILKSRQMKE